MGDVEPSILCVHVKPVRKQQFLHMVGVDNRSYGHSLAGAYITNSHTHKTQTHTGRTVSCWFQQCFHPKKETSHPQSQLSHSPGTNTHESHSLLMFFINGSILKRRIHIHNPTHTISQSTHSYVPGVSVQYGNRDSNLLLISADQAK